MPIRGTTVHCTDLYGQSVAVDTESLQFRPSAYGIFVRSGKVLLLRVKATGRFFPPGGAQEKGETIQAALIREFAEETGLQVSIGRLLAWKESFFYYNPLATSWQCLSLFFLCYDTDSKQSSLRDGDANSDVEATFRPSWIPIKALSASDFQVFGDELINLLHEL